MAGLRMFSYLPNPLRLESDHCRPVLRRRGRGQRRLAQGVAGLAVGLRRTAAGRAGASIAVVPCPNGTRRFDQRKAVQDRSVPGSAVVRQRTRRVRARCSADPGAPAGKERTVSFGVGSVTARFLWRLGNAPANFARGSLLQRGSSVGSGQGDCREDEVCRTRHLFLPCHGTDRIGERGTEQLWLSCRRAARDRTEACGCTSQGEKNGPVTPSRDQTG